MATDPAMKIVPPFTPELLPSVQEAVEQFLKGRSIPFVLEVGSGWSTIWLAKLADLVHSIEHDKGWHDEVCKVYDEQEYVGALRIELVSGADGVVREVVDYNEQYDLVLIDCIDEARLPSLFACLTKVKDDGWIVLDDSHWPIFKGAPTVMENLGYQWKMLSGNHIRKTGETCYHQTTIFCKKGF